MKNNNRFKLSVLAAVIGTNLLMAGCTSDPVDNPIEPPPPGDSESRWLFEAQEAGEIVEIPVKVADDFSADHLQGTPFGGTWEIKNGMLQQTDAARGGKVRIDDHEFDDFTLSTTLRLADGTGDAGVIFRADNFGIGADDLNGYYVGIKSSGAIVLGEMNQDWKVLKEEKAAIELDRDYKLEIIAKGNNVEIYLDDELTISEAINNYQSGYVGFRSHRAALGVTDLTIADGNGDLVLDYDPTRTWSTYGGEWIVEDGSYLQTKGGDKDYGYKTVLEGSDVSDFTLTATMIPEDYDKDASDAGIIFRVQNAELGQDSMEGYYVAISGENKIVLGSLNNNWQQIDSAHLPFAPKKEYQVKIEAEGAKIKIYVDDVLKIDVENGDHSSGAVGFRTHMASARYKNLKMDGVYIDAMPKIGDTPYLMAHFKNGAEKLFYAKSDDALIWSALNNGQPVFDANDPSVRLRDPYIQRVTRNGKDTFHLIHTKGWDNTGIFHWTSDDLMNWEGGYHDVMAGTEAPNAWAPEFFYDDEDDLFYVFWTSRTPRQPGEGGDNGEEPDDWTEKIWYTTTSDWVNFKDSDVYFYPNFDVIDANIIKLSDGTYQMAYKTEFGGHGERHTLIATSTSLNPEVDRFEGQDDVLPTIRGVEGPQQLQVSDGDEEKIYLYYDFFANGGYWGAAETTDNVNWEPLPDSDVRFPAGARHGSVVELSWQEMANLNVSGNGSATGIISHLEKDDEYGFHFALEGEPVRQPACATSDMGWYMNLNNDNGHELYNRLLDAQAVGQEVKVYGQGRCLFGERDAEVPGEVVFPEA